MMTPSSVPLENCGIICVPFSILARQYNRAASILAGKEQNISDPGKGDNLPRYVANQSVNAPSYVVCKNAPYDMERTMCVALLVLILRPMTYVHIL